MNILTNTKKDYKRWEDKKLESFTQNISDLTVEIRNPNIVSKPEKSMVISILEQHNLVFFHINNNKYADKSCIKKLAHDLGLGDYEYDSKSDVDGLTEIKDHHDEQLSTEYIPYTNKELKWHTDGYYNDESNSILSWLLFCRSQAEKGGKNKYFDHEIAYILFNHESKHLGDLMKSDAYCIPKNSMSDRKEIYNPVFNFFSEKLHMKFSMREKNIIWNKDCLEAVAILKKIINDSSEFHIEKKFTEGEGVITNNVIHMRTSFTNSENKHRLLYRLRSKKKVEV